jgi:uncharacterized RDD family membrane protein YckC
MPPSAGDLSPPLMMAPGLAQRMAAWLYEGVLLFGVVFVACLVFIAVAFAVTFGRSTPTSHSPVYDYALQAFEFIVIGLYFIICWSKGQGQTLAMKTWRIRAVDVRGQRLTRTRALGRYLLCWIWFLPPLALARLLQARLLHFPPITIAALCLVWIVIWVLSSRLRRDRQFWHDVWAGTRLIKADPASATAPPTF